MSRVLAIIFLLVPCVAATHAASEEIVAVNSAETRFSCGSHQIVRSLVTPSKEYKFHFDEGKATLSFPSSAENKPTHVFIGCEDKLGKKMFYDVAVLPQKSAAKREIDATTTGSPLRPKED